MRAEGNQHANDLIDALDAAHRALAFNAQLPEARFNLALILERFALWFQARREWEFYLSLDSESNCSKLAHQHLDRLSVLMHEPDWSRFREHLRAAARAGQEEAVAASIVQSPQVTREFGEQQLLAEWGQATKDNDTALAAEALNAARVIGESLARFNGDYLLLDSVHHLTDLGDAATKEPLPDVASAFVLLGQTWPLLERRNYEESVGRLHSALPVLQRSGSPMARWVILYIAVYRYQRSEYDSAYRALTRLVGAPDADRYPSLLARALRIQAVIQRLRGNLTAGCQLYEEALGEAERTGEGEAIAGTQVALAGTFDALGDRNRFWRLEFAALQHRGDTHRPDLLYTVFVESARRLAHWGTPRPAIPFQEEAAEIALGSGDPVLATDASRELAILLEAMGDSAGALEALAKSARASESIASLSVRSFFTMENLRYRGRILAKSNPAGARRALDETIARGEEIGYRSVLPSAYLDRAKLFRQQGQSDAAETDLLRAVEEIDRQRTKVDESSYRISFFDQSQRVYDELISLAIEKGEAERAFYLSERARARVLLDQILDHGDSIAAFPALSGHPEALQVSTLQGELDGGSLLIEYGIYGDAVVAWAISAKRFGLVRLPISSAALAGQVLGLRKAIRSAKPDMTSQPLLEDLYTELIRPFESSLRGISSLVIIPHHILFEVPFSALRDRGTGRRLIDVVSTTISPSARVYLALGGVRRTTCTRRPTVLAVSSPTPSLGSEADFGPLGGSRAEAESVVRLYSGRSLLLGGTDVTRKAVISLAPKFDILHFATHAVVEHAHPLHSRLILGHNDSENAKEAALTAEAILGLDLHHTSLVVLAACNSAVGIESPTEGPLSLARPFMVAGVPTVVASLWQVDDRQSQRLLIRFYRGLVRGLPVAEAMRQAKLSLAAQFPEMTLEVWGAFEVYGSGSVKFR